MLSGLFDQSTVPVLEQVVAFSETRHNVLAGNIANMDTPGYIARDLSVDDFQSRLEQAIDQKRHPSLVSAGAVDEEPRPQIAGVAKDTKSILHHDKSKVGMEFQVSEMVKNQMQHNMALQIMVQQFNQLKMAVSGRV